MLVAVMVAQETAFPVVRCKQQLSSIFPLLNTDLGEPLPELYDGRRFREYAQGNPSQRLG